MRTFACFAIILLLACTSKPANNTQHQPTDTVSLPIAQAENFPKIEAFQHPQQLASALAKLGLGQLSDWDYVGDYWGASTAEYEFGTEGKKGMKNTLVFHLESTEGNFVKTLKLALRLNNPDERKAALSRFTNLADQTFRTINVSMPGQLKPALQQGKSIHYADSTMTVTNQYIEDTVDLCTLAISTQ